MIRVKKHVPIPHNVIIPGVGTVAFTPRPVYDAKFKAEFEKWATNALETQKNMYEDDKEGDKLNLAEYRTRTTSQVEALHELFDSLNEAQRARTLAFMKAEKERDRLAKEAEIQRADDEAKRKMREAEEERQRLIKEGKLQA